MKSLPPYILRMQEEQAQLSDRVVSAESFTHTDKFKAMSVSQKQLLLTQLEHMEEYLEVLSQRIGYAVMAEGRTEDKFPDGHPDWTKSEWQTDVALDNTLLGYWDWVEHNLTVAASEAVDGN